MCLMIFGYECGAGSCEDDVCICNPGFFASQDFFANQPGAPCFAHKSTLVTIYWISLIMFIVQFFANILSTTKTSQRIRLIPLLLLGIVFAALCIERALTIDENFLGTDLLVTVLYSLGVSLIVIVYSVFLNRHVKFLSKAYVAQVLPDKKLLSVWSKRGLFIIPLVAVILTSLLVVSVLTSSNETKKLLHTIYWYGIDVLFMVLFVLLQRLFATIHTEINDLAETSIGRERKKILRSLRYIKKIWLQTRGILLSFIIIASLTAISPYFIAYQYLLAINCLIGSVGPIIVLALKVRRKREQTRIPTATATTNALPSPLLHHRH